MQDKLEQIAEKQKSADQPPEQDQPSHEETTGSTGDHEKEVGKYRKLQLPIFDGEDPIGWLFRVERYFRINAVAEMERLEAAIVCLEGKALNWYQWVETRAPIREWSEFKQELLRRFHPS